MAVPAFWAASALAAGLPSAPMVIAVLENTFAAPVYVAAANGYFAAEGLNVRLDRCKVGRTCMEKLLSGQARFATSADTPLMFSSLKNPGFSVLATLTTSSMENRIVVRTDRGIRAVPDIKGKRIGAIKGTSSHYFMRSVLTYNGFGPADAEVSWLDPDDLNGPIVRGEVDAVSVFGTQVHDVLRDLGGRGVALPPMRYFSVIFNLVSAPRRAGSSEEDDVKLLRALRRAEDYLRKNPEQSIRLVSEALKVDRAAIAATWGHYEFRLHLGQSLIHVLESQFRWATREQLVPAGTAMPDFLDLLRPGPLRQLDPRSVRLVQ
ncbi:MAG: ABC transporter substrate-binding protein [Burkholderiales bacterium]|nr:ABC transporter substrate-binding protein [Burkholderiales bacterium]